MIVKLIELGTWMGTHALMHLLKIPVKGTTLLNHFIIIIINNFCLNNYIILQKIFKFWQMLTNANQ